MPSTQQLTTPGLIAGVKRIKQTFPNLPAGFYDILCERLKANEFTDERFEAAVNNVIDNCKYPTPTIADFLSYNIPGKINLEQLINERRNHTS